MTLTLVDDDSFDGLSTDVLLERIIDEHNAMREQVVSGLQRSIVIGEMLLVIRERITPSEWARWVEANLPFTITWANVCMRCARYQDVILASDATQVQEAIRVVKDMPFTNAAGRTRDTTSWMAREAPRLRKDGATYKEIAASLGVTDRRAWALCNPKQDKEQKAKDYRKLKEAKRALKAKVLASERSEAEAALKRKGGSTASAYALLRRAAAALDQAMSEVDVRRRPELRSALASVHKAEDDILAALKIERQHAG